MTRSLPVLLLSVLMLHAATRPAPAAEPDAALSIKDIPTWPGGYQVAPFITTAVKFQNSRILINPKHVTKLVSVRPV
jgi:hypothetical protein